MLSEILKNLRTSKGNTQDDMAELLNIKRQTYSAYERGISVPDAATLSKLADYFDVTVDYLLERPNISSDAVEIVRIYVDLTQDNKAKVLEYAELLHEKELKQC